jgi:selenium-binding protein 1
MRLNGYGRSAHGLTERWSVLMGLFALTLVVAAATRARGDVCNSPFLKYLQRPERIMYVWCLDAHGKNNDFMAIVDVDPGSRDYGRIVKTVDLGSKNNETHHFGFTDDRRYIYGATLFTSKLYLFDVATNPNDPKLLKVIDYQRETGLTSPHSLYALPGRMMIPSLGNAQGDVPAGIAEYTNDGKYIRTTMNPADSPYGYDTGVKPEIDRLVSSGFTPLDNFTKPFPQMDKTHFGDQLILWDFSRMKPIATAKTGKSPLEVRWARQPGHNYGFTNCLLGDSIWLFRPTADGKLEAKLATKTEPLPADLRQSVDDKYLYVTSFGAGDVEQFDISDPDHVALHSRVHIGAHPNMMNISTDGRRMFVTNSLLSTADFGPDDFWMKLVRIDDNGVMHVDPKFNVNFTTLPNGPGRPHDMLEN